MHRLSMSLVSSFVSSQLTSSTCLCNRSFWKKGTLHISLGGMVSSLSLCSCIIAYDFVFQGLSPISAWMCARLIHVVEDLSLPAMLATSATSSHSLFKRERKKLMYRPSIFVRVDMCPADSKFGTKYLCVPRGTFQLSFVKVPQQRKYFSLPSS